MAKEGLSFKVNGLSYSVKGISGYSPLSFPASYSLSGGRSYSAGAMKGYSIKQMYPVSHIIEVLKKEGICSSKEKT